MGIHDGHRERVKARFTEQGLDGFAAHEALELLLFYCVPRKDTNPLAHRLVDTFGGLAAVFDAPREELLKVDGVGENAATLIKLIPELARKYMVDKTSFNKVLNSSKLVGEYLTARFFGETDEVVYLLCLDAKCKVISCKLLFRGGVNSAGINVRKVVETAIAAKASFAVLAHNHPSGIALPSREDEITTTRIKQALQAVDIRLLDHIIVANDDFVSLADNGFFS